MAHHIIGGNGHGDLDQVNIVLRLTEESKLWQGRAEAMRRALTVTEHQLTQLRRIVWLLIDAAGGKITVQHTRIRDTDFSSPATSFSIERNPEKNEDIYTTAQKEAGPSVQQQPSS